ncbi:MAG TPA: GntR family transcriptional regulator [Anaerolineaceae bacterium]|jgi:DNA-binding GntR family transcriptional regulator|nr:GntR family transcriptional regulator [Anaerolineaceae bacterium]
MDPLSPVRGPYSLNEQAYQAIKEAILNFRLKPGQDLVEADLARMLGMSKTPVRDALLQLEKEGLVTKVLFKGTYVSDITPKSLIEIFEIRAVLEGLAARLAAPNFTDSDAVVADAYITKQGQALRAGNLEKVSEYNRQFHEVIINLQDNEMLKPILRNLDDQLRRFRTLSTYQRGQADKSVNEHRKILDALRANDPEQAEQTMRSHLTSVLADMTRGDIKGVIAEVTHSNKPED